MAAWKCANGEYRLIYYWPEKNMVVNDGVARKIKQGEAVDGLPLFEETQEYKSSLEAVERQSALSEIINLEAKAIRPLIEIYSLSTESEKEKPKAVLAEIIAKIEIHAQKIRNKKEVQL